MELNQLHQSITKPRLITHRGKCTSAKKNHSAPTQSSDIAFYTEDNEHLPTGFPQKLLENHHFNQQVSVLLANSPDAIVQSVSSKLNAAVAACPAYIIDADLSKLLSIDFIKSHISSRSDIKFYAVSVDTPLDRVNALSISAGSLWLSLDKDTYTTLGIAAPHSIIQDRYRLHIDLSPLAPASTSQPPAPSSSSISPLVATPAILKRLQWCLAASRVGTLRMGVTASKGGLPVEVVFPEGVEVVRKLRAKPVSCSQVKTHIPNVSELTKIPDSQAGAVKPSKDAPATSSSASSSASSASSASAMADDDDFLALGSDSDEGSDAEDLNIDDDKDEDEDGDGSRPGSHGRVNGIHSRRRVDPQPPADLALHQLWRLLGLYAMGLSQPLADLRAVARTHAQAQPRAKAGSFALSPAPDSLSVRSNAFSLLDVSAAKLPVHTLTARLLLPPTVPVHAAKLARAAVARGQAQWAAVLVHGVPDAVCGYARSVNAHSCGAGGVGESVFAIVFGPEDRYVVLWGVDGGSAVM
jgi:hypothetical protein